MIVQSYCWRCGHRRVRLYQECRRIDVPLSIHVGLAPAIAAGTTFVLALVVLQLCSAVYKKRHEQLENEFDKEEKDD